jgi:two-component system, LytTR family, response regulator LytT
VQDCLDVLVVDDEPPAVDVLVHYLRRDRRIRRIHTAASGLEALRVLDGHHVDAVFVDIHMPSLTGIDLARVLNRFADPPAIVFVTADDGLALTAFEVRATDYLLKPIVEARVREAVGRLGGKRLAAPAAPQLVTVDQGGVSRMIRQDDVLYAEASGDYVRLHTAHSDFLVRIPISKLEEQWSDEGFVRIHRSYLVALRHVDHVRFVGATGQVVVGHVRLPISRRSAAQLRSSLKAHRVRHRS